MMEEYLDGAEVDVDLVFSNGEARYGAVTDNWPTLVRMPTAANGVQDYLGASCTLAGHALHK